MSDSIEITPSNLNGYLLGSLPWCGVDWAASANRSWDWIRIYRRILSRGFYHLPLHLIVDLYEVLSLQFEVRFRSESGSSSHAREDDDPEKIRMRYERECLGRLLQAPDVSAALEIVETSGDREACVERLLIQLVRQIGPHYPKWAELNPGLLRDYNLSLAGADPAALHAEFVAGLESSPFAGGLEQFLAAINEHVRWGQLLHDEDLFELAHLESLSTDHLRIGCRQIVEVSRRLASLQPLQLDLATHEEGAETAFVDESHYPTGGLSGLANRGSFENLVTSELVYLDEGTDDFSLFDLRHVEGELLFYLRDSGNLRRKRRTIHFLIDCGNTFESKSLGYDYQYSVLIQGLCLRLMRDLFKVFEQDALRFEFHYLAAEAASGFLESEIGMMRTVLADAVKHDWVRFHLSGEEPPSLEELIDPKRKSYAVVLAEGGRAPSWQKKIEALAEEEIPLFSALVAVDDQGDDDGPAFQLSLPRSGLDLPELSRRKDAVLEKLVS